MEAGTRKFRCCRITAAEPSCTGPAAIKGLAVHKYRLGAVFTVSVVHSVTLIVNKVSSVLDIVQPAGTLYIDVFAVYTCSDVF